MMLKKAISKMNLGFITHQGRSFATPTKQDMLNRAAAYALKNKVKESMSHFKFENSMVFKPLVIVGPICSGKTTLINYLRHN